VGEGGSNYLREGNHLKEKIIRAYTVNILIKNNFQLKLFFTAVFSNIITNIQ